MMVMKENLNFLTLQFQILQNPMTYDLEKDILKVLRSGGKSVIFRKILSHVQGYNYSWVRPEWQNLMVLSLLHLILIIFFVKLDTELDRDENTYLACCRCKDLNV